ncbi:lysine--tRNA ligase [Candidatus Woesearchaeota archaeon B3_Woes]|nr:MAG: lysine--tRNA ligase [Candidatus Woesearchaeota archaeon B3_Woes]
MTEESEGTHWADQTADSIIEKRGNKKEYVVATGATPSGILHVGNFREFIMGDFIAKALRHKGKKAIHCHYWDDYDVFRKVPVNMPKQGVLKKCLRKPLVDVPDVIDGKHKNYTTHFEEDFEHYLPIVGLSPEIIRNSEQYQKCVLADQIKTALEKTDKIKEFLNEYRKEDLAEEWLPISVYDEKTHFEATETRYPGGYEIEYKDNDGNWQKFDFRKKGFIKLKYRIQVPAFWQYKGVDFESAGKDHYASGGVFDIAPKLAKEVYGIKPALGYGFGWISIKGGGQFSSSGGVVVTLKDVLDVYEPSMVRWFFAGSRPLSEFAISFDLDVLKYYEDFDRCERIYYKKEEAKDKREFEKQKRIYELSAVELSKKMPFQPLFRHLTTMYQLYQGNFDKIKEYYDLKNKEDEERLKLRTKCVGNWLEKHAPDDMKFEVQEEVSSEVKKSLSSEQKKALGILKDRLSSKKYDENSLYEDFMNICNEAGTKPLEFFRGAYRVLLNKEKGPKLAGFIMLLGVKRVIKLLEEV